MYKVFFFFTLFATLFSNVNACDTCLQFPSVGHQTGPNYSWDVRNLTTDECCDECLSEDGCQGWTWTNLNWDSTGTHCFMYSEPSDGVTPHSDCVSGNPDPTPCPSCTLLYRLMFAHSETHQSYKATLVTPYEGNTHDITCEAIGTSHHFVGVGPEKESHVARLYENADCTGAYEDVTCSPWLDYSSMPSSAFGTCSHDGTTLSITGLPKEVTHVMSGGDWTAVPVVEGAVDVVCPGASGEVGVCSGPDCDWLTEFLYNLVEAGSGSCSC